MLGRRGKPPDERGFHFYIPHRLYSREGGGTLEPPRTSVAIAILVLLSLGPPASAVALEDVVYDPVGDVVDGATNLTVNLPGIDILNARVDDLAGDLEISITLAGSPLAEGEYTVNVMVDSTDLFTFTRSDLGEYYANDPLGAPVAVIGWLDPDRVVWEVSTALLSVGTGLAVLSSYTFVTNSTGAILADSLEVTPPANDPPVVAITSPSDGANVTGIVTVTGTATDDSGVTAVFLRVDGGDWSQVMGTDPWSHNLDTTGLSDGTHTLEARAFDGELSSAVVSVTVNWALGGFEPPQVLISWPDGHAVSGTMTVTGTAADDGGLDRVEVRVDGGAWQVASGTNAWSLDVDTTALSLGEHALEAIAYDLAGEAARVASTTFVVAEDPSVNRPPTATVTTPRSGSVVYFSTRPYNLMVTASDDVAVVGVEVRWEGVDWMACTLSGDSWTLSVDTRTQFRQQLVTLEARAFDGELYSEVTRSPFSLESNSPPVVTLTSTKRTSQYLLVSGTAIDEDDPIVSVEVYLEGEGSGMLSFEVVGGDPKHVTWTHKQLFRGLAKDMDYFLTITASDAYNSGDGVDVMFQRTDTDSGVDPRTPGPGPSSVILAMTAAMVVLMLSRGGRRR